MSAVRKCTLALFVVTATANAATTAWTGAVNNLWSVGGNWNGGVAPASGDGLIIPAGGANTSMTNDLPAGLALQSLSFTSSSTSYSLSGNGIRLSGGLTTVCCPLITVNLPITLTSSQSLTDGGQTNFAGPIDLNSFTLTLNPYVTTISGSLIGSGALILNSGGGVNLTGTSTFSGTITASGPLNVAGTITNATLTSNGARISGNGAVAVTSLINAPLSVGNDSGAGCCADPHSTGILSTGNLSIQGGSVQFDLVNPTPGTGYDQINTTGTVTLTNPSLQVSLPLTIPTVGQSFIVINNDGTDPIVGTFNGLSEGAIFTVGSTQFRISYVGGTGNDVVLTVLAGPKAWTGGVNNLWSVGGNWNGGVAPASGDGLIIPAGGANTSMTNDLPAGLALQSLSFTSSSTSYSLSGNGIRLSGGLTTVCCPLITVNLPITLTSSQSFTDGGQTNFAGPIDLNSFTLTLNPYVTTISGSLIGSGALILNSGGGVNLTGTSTFSGTITASGPLNVAGTITNATLTSNGARISGNGAVAVTSLINAPLSVGNDSGAGCCADPHSTGILSTGNLSIQGGSVQFDLVNQTPGTGYDQINTTGTVTLTNPSLQVSLPLTIPTVGQSFIVINNDGTDPIVGTFNGLSEGAIFTVGSTQFRISYVGGTGNDVVLTVLAGPKAWTGGVNNLWSVGGNWNGGVAPASGDGLIIPAGGANTSMTNDLPAGLALQSLSFTSSSTSYSLSGNGIRLSGGLTTVCCPLITVNLPITLTSSQSFTDGGQTNFAGPIDLNSFTLTLNPYVTTISGSLIGSGALILNSGGGVNLTGTSTFSGTITASGPLNVAGTITNATLTSNGARISGNGAVAVTSLINAPLSVGNDSGAGCCADPHSTGILSTGNLSIQGGSVQFDLVNPTPGTGYDQINTTGTVTLTNPSLQVSLPLTIPTVGQSFIVINNDGTDPIVGTFNGLSEGAIFTVGSTQFRISYVGGTGNDVVLTTVAAAAIPAMGDMALVFLAALLAFVAMHKLGSQ